MALRLGKGKMQSTNQQRDEQACSAGGWLHRVLADTHVIGVFKRRIGDATASVWLVMLSFDGILRTK
ncbi:hypothetical protein QQF64_004258 [Cirrhinus molitorella]|uniref:Uncharacterized protein n=1 Tax=Cirrhinus molitorella TaxID=172907 RepID=A0ABR3MFN8_9TELE